MGDMTTMESIGFVIFLVMTVAFFAWVAYLTFSKVPSSSEGSSDQGDRERP